MDGIEPASMNNGRLLLIAVITVARDAVAAFRSYEEGAARIMARYGGAIERTVALDDDPSADGMRELHLVAFPDRPAFDAYRADPELNALAELRASSIIHTEILAGTDGPTYGAGGAHSL
ncbi:MAG TPA: hypothetical protein VHI13_12195 [Candidatus Kapabacteria bacterium]|nr:hypothetical protein [Candidatus Kapabacteria bacterium]